MNIKGIYECESKRLEKLRNFQLPNHYKKIGTGLFIVAVIAILSLRFLVEDAGIFMSFAKNIILLSLLIISVSKDKIEDELTVKLRSQSYSMSFIVGIFYALAQPYVNYTVAKILGENDVYSELRAFEILWFLLIVQLLFFYKLKRAR